MLIGLGTTSSPNAALIASTIQQVEGYYPGSLAYTNNNPGNLIYVGQTGATPGAGGFAAFPSYDAGYQALLNQIQNYANRGLTIDQMMNLYAPAGQGSNNPTAYANTIASALGVSTDTTVADALAGAGMASGTTADTMNAGVISTDTITNAFSDLATAASSGDFSGMSSSDWLVIGGSLALVMVVGYQVARR
jgi:hypothetical protein